jgi:transposase
MPRMPQPGEDDQNSSHAEEIILGVDTHKDVHVAAVITSLGALRETTTFPATAAGYQALLAWAGTFGVLRRAGGEGTGSYGAALARHLRAADIEVIGVNQPDKAARRRQGKTDALDAQAAARAVLSGQRAAHSCNWRTVVAVTAIRIVVTDCPVESTATAVSELLCGSIPMVIMHRLPSRDRGDPATGSLTSGRSMPL